MIHYRPFRNCDPPAICDIWRSQPPQRGLMQPMTPAVLEYLVLSKPYFDREGLIVAVENDQPIGFAHAGFGAAASGAELSYELGTTCLVMAVPNERDATIRQELLQRSEEFLSSKGASSLFGGCFGSLAAFYFGLYGGCGLSGVLESDEAQIKTFREADYEEVGRSLVLHRELAGFRPPVSRDMMQMRRQYQIERIGEPLPKSWWEACKFGHIDPLGFQLMPRAGEAPGATVYFWDIEPLASTWGVHAMGLLELEIADAEHRAALASFLLGEAIRDLQSMGVTLVELHLPDSDSELIEICNKMGFQQLDQAIQFHKRV